jgi:hypothetical protein
MACTKPPSSSAEPSTNDAASEVGELAAASSFEVGASMDGDGFEAPSTTGLMEPSFGLDSTKADDVVQPTAPSRNAVRRTVRDGFCMVTQ